jgi:hypothetical protein
MIGTEKCNERYLRLYVNLNFSFILLFCCFAALPPFDAGMLLDAAASNAIAFSRSGGFHIAIPVKIRFD